MARAYSVYEAKARLSELLRLVEGGGEVSITRHGQPIARLVGVERPGAGPEETLAGRLRRLERDGLAHVTPARKPPKEAFVEQRANSRLPPGALAQLLASRD